MALDSSEPRSVPWVDWTEWTQVDQLLSSGLAAEQRRGIARVEAWRARGSVPGVVDAAARLRELALDDKVIAAARESDLAIRLAYSMAIVQLVNGVTGRIQKSKEKKSVSDLSREVSLPQLLVDLRHDATHKTLPSMQRLRAASGAALHWIGQFYWTPQRARVVEIYAQRPAAIVALVHAYLDAISAGKGAEAVTGAIDAVVEALQELRHTQAFSEILVPLFLDGTCRRRFRCGASSAATRLMVPLAPGGDAAAGTAGAAAAAARRVESDDPPPAKKQRRTTSRADFAKIARRFVRERNAWLPLLAVLNVRWASLVPLLIEGCVARVLAEEGRSNDGCAARLYYLCAWAQLLLHPCAIRESGGGGGGGYGVGDATPFDAHAALGGAADAARALASFDVRGHIGWLASALRTATPCSSLWSVWLVCALLSPGSSAREHLLAAAAVSASSDASSTAEQARSDVVRLGRVAALRFAALKLSSDPTEVTASGGGRSGSAGALASAGGGAVWQRCTAWYACPIGCLPSGAALPLDLDRLPPRVVEPTPSAAAAQEEGAGSASAVAAAAAASRGLKLSWW